MKLKVVKLITFCVIIVLSMQVCSLALNEIDAGSDISADSFMELADFLKNSNSNHVRRIDAIEDMYSIVFANSDATNTEYRFNEPIKYYDENGELIDKSNRIVRMGATYRNVKNDVGFTAYDDLGKGVDISYKGKVINIKAVPRINSIRNASASITSSECSITHKSYVARNVNITYAPTFSGTDITLNINSADDNEPIEFDITALGCSTSLDASGNIEIRDGGDVIIAKIYAFKAVDNAGNSIPVVVSNSQISQNNSNRYAFALEANALESDIQYPVTAQASAETIHRTSGTVEYLALYANGTSATNIGATNTENLLVGYDTVKRTSRILYRFPYITDTLFDRYYADRLVSVKLVQGVVPANTNTSLTARHYTGAAWGASTKFTDVNWNSYYTGYSANSVDDGLNYMNANCRLFSIDITPLVEIWRDSPTLLNPDRGIMVTNPNGEYLSSPSTISIYARDDYSMPQTATSAPYLQITYRAIDIMLDPGHYAGYNHGAYNPYDEGTKMWELFIYLRQALRDYGFNVDCTRPNSATDVETDDRGLSAAGHDMFISLHSNGSSDPSSNYVIVYYDVNNKNNASVLAQTLSNTVKNTMNSVGDLNITKAKTGAKAYNADQPNLNYYAVLRYAATTDCPLYFIIEHSFHSNYDSCYSLYQSDTLRAIAAAEAAVINDFYTN